MLQPMRLSKSSAGLMRIPPLLLLLLLTTPTPPFLVFGTVTSDLELREQVLVRSLVTGSDDVDGAIEGSSFSSSSLSRGRERSGEDERLWELWETDLSFALDRPATLPLGAIGTLLKKLLDLDDTADTGGDGEAGMLAYYKFHTSKGRFVAKGGGRSSSSSLRGDASTRDVRDYFFNGIGTHITSRCVKPLESILADRMKELFTKWFAMSLTRDTLRFSKQSDSIDRSGKNPAGFVDNVWVSHEDGLTMEGLANFLMLASPLGNDFGVSSLLKQRLSELTLEGERGQFQVSRGKKGRINFMGIEVEVSVFRGAGIGGGAYTAQVRTKFEVVSAVSFGGSKRRAGRLADPAQRVAEETEKWARKYLKRNCDFCSSSKLIMRLELESDSAAVMEMDLKGTGEKTGQQEDRMSNEQRFLPKTQELRAKRYLTGHSSSLYLVENFELNFKEELGKAQNACFCLASYVPFYLNPLFSASKVVKRIAAAEEGEEEEEMACAESWSLFDLGAEITFVRSDRKSKVANFLKVCLPIEKIMSNHTTGDDEQEVKVSLAFRKSFPSVFSLPADRSAGLYLPASCIYREQKGREERPRKDAVEDFSFLCDKSRSPRVGDVRYLYPLRVQFPLPDASMPYNACIITCTVYVGLFGFMLKNLKYILKPKGGGVSKGIVQKVLLNALILFTLIGIIFFVDSETKLYLESLF